MTRESLAVLMKACMLITLLALVQATGANAAVSITATHATADEYGPVAGTFTISRGDTGSSQNIRIIPSGTATSTTDYTVSSSLPIAWGTTLPMGTLTGNYSLTMAPGVDSGTVTITPVNDTTVESPETVIMTISPQPEYTVVGAGHRVPDHSR